MEQIERRKMDVMIEASPNALILINNQGEIGDLNSNAEKLLLFNKSELVGKKMDRIISDPVSGESSRILQFIFDDQISLDQDCESNFFAIKKNGNEFPIEINVISNRIENKSLAIISIVDVTAKKEVEDQLERYKFFFHHSHDLTCIANVDGYFELINSQFTKLLGYSESELLEKQFLEFIHPDDLAATYDEIEKLQKGALTLNFENRYKKKKGEYLWFEWNATPDVSTGKLYGIARDITARKIAEAQFRLVVESVPNAIILVNEKGEITMLNHQAEIQFGYSKEELIGNNLEILTPKRYRNHHIAHRDLFLRKPQTRSMGAGRDLYALRKDGTEFPAEIGLNPIDVESEVLILTSIVDITERKKLEKAVLDNSEKLEKQNIELRDSEQKLKELNATKDKFFSIIAHDLKNPFNIILGYANLLFDQYDSLDECEKIEFINEINLSAKSTFSLLDNLLTWSISQQGKIVLNREEYNLLEFIESSIDSYLPNSRQKEIVIDLEIPADQTIYVDKYTIGIVIGNLVSNAIKFTPEGGSISISSQNNTDRIDLYIKDTGVGMSQEQIEKLFKVEISNSTPGTNNEQGTGLGLILCKEFIEKNFGDIEIKSRINEGTSFRFSIPTSPN